MPPKRSMKPRKSAPKKKAYKPKSKGGKKPVLGRSPSSGGPSKVVVRQQNLGSQTENKVSHRMGRPDSRAYVMKQISPVCHFVDTEKGNITTLGINGRQAWGFLTLSDQTDLTEIGTQLVANNSPAFPGAAPSQYLLTKLENKIKFSNAGQGNCRLTIMHVRAKRDLYNTMTYVTPTLATYAWSTIVDSIQQGLAAACAGPTSGDVSYLIPGMDEDESPIFRKYFEKVKTTEVFLAVGGTHTLNTNLYYDRVLDASVYGNDNITGVTGITEYLLFKAEGQTGVDNLVGTATIAPCQIVYTTNWDYSFVQVQASRRFVKVDDPVGANANGSTVISASTGVGIAAVGIIA